MGGGQLQTRVADGGRHLGDAITGLQDAQAEIIARLARLESNWHERMVLEEKVRSLTEKEATARAEVEAERRRAAELAGEVATLQRYLHWRTVALEILLLGVASITAVIWITHWWPW
jgi:chromosome segregation ATPase